MSLTRFEKKILAAILAVALVPLLGVLLLGRAVLQEAYRVGVNPLVEAELEDALALYRAHFVALREDAERTTDAVAFDYRLVEAARADDAEGTRGRLRAMLARYPHVARIVVAHDDGAEIASVSAEEQLDATVYRHLPLEREVEGEDVRVVVTVATPLAPFAAYQRAGEVTEVYQRLREGADVVSGFYLVVFFGFLLSVVIAALGIGVITSRRVTRRVADLAEATAKVGAGDLSIEVPVLANDEVGELTRAFNRMVRDLRQSRERIEYLKRIGAWQEFARRLAHEIKNPLTPIQLAAQEVHRAYTGDDAKYRQKLEDARAIIEEEVATLRRLVGEFSAFAKLPRAELSASDLGDFVSDFERSIGPMLEGFGEDGVGVDIRVEGGDAPLPVEIDSMMLKRGVDNLVRNAVQAMGGRETGSVVVAARREGREAILEVRDDGPGVAADKRAQIFDPYYTTKSDGTGLGLAIVKKVVLEHGGEIECVEAEEGGAVFRIRLPLLEADAVWEEHGQQERRGVVT